MCVGCGLGVPACMIDSSCSSAVAQQVKTVALAASPVVAGAGIWLQTKIIKKKTTKNKKTNEKI